MSDTLSFLLNQSNTNPTSGGGGARWSDNATIETSRQCDMCFGLAAIMVGAWKSPPVPTQSPRTFAQPVRYSRGSCCRLSCYVFVCFGNGFQVAIVAHVTWWLMGMSAFSQHPVPNQKKKTLKWNLSAIQDEGHVEQVLSVSPDTVTHWHVDAHFSFGPSGHAFKSRKRPFCKQGWVCGAVTAQPPKEKLRLYAWTVWGSLYSSSMSPHGGGLIGGPKEPPVLSPLITKASRCVWAEDGGEGK